MSDQSRPPDAAAADPASGAVTAPDASSRDAPARARYHHGDLRAALLDAAERVMAEKGVEAFSIADAAREVGVSAPACYRHFKDKADLVGEVAARGFRRLADASRAAKAEHPRGAVDALIALGVAYVEFVAGRPELYHVMWGAVRERFEHPVAETCGSECYGVFLETLDEVRAAQRLEAFDLYELGTPLWAMVHGLASLTLGKSKFLDPDPDSRRRLVARATRAYIDGLRHDDARADGDAATPSPHAKTDGTPGGH